MRDTGQCQTQTKGATGGFDDSRTRPQRAARHRAFDHVQRGAVLHPARIVTLEFGPEPLTSHGERLPDPEHRGVPDERRRAAARLFLGVEMIGGQDDTIDNGTAHA
ncbi:hypothetical protein GCM10009764_51610 [Nocardia ninae]|uniref:Uncharacterized protein n=1 Tax=Nocardia ninae NBRC 108245 TaxID=1210091 RepID=A0A511M5W6_9NOCA|nr:hypothetical protein NN4_05520 [Nocardia ninae NBRC 108245]